MNLSIHLFKVRWNDHLVSYFPLMVPYGIDTIVLHVTFPPAKFSNLFCIRLQEHYMKNKMS